MSLSIRIEPRRLHFKFPAGTSRGVYTVRSIWLLHLSDPARPAFCGTGECAPLSGLSPEYGAAYEARLRQVCREVERTGTVDKERLRAMPSVLFGLETAFLAAGAAEKGDAALFDTPFARGEAGMPINGLVWMGDRPTMLRRLSDKLSQGFRCIKLKIGAIDFDDELGLLARVRDIYNTGRVMLRVDANGAFSPPEAMERLRRLAAFGLHSIEQPIRPRQWEQMACFCRESPVPVALDEELIGIHRPADKERLLDKLRPAYLVLKPTLHGGLSGCEEWIQLAERRGIGWWVTSALESNVGLCAISQWTARLLHRRGLLVRPRIPLFQGLGTGQLFTDNIPMPQLQLRGDELWHRILTT